MDENSAQMPVAQEETAMWAIDVLSQPPVVYPAEGFEEEGVEALFFEGLPWRGEPTRVFAWMGVPEVDEGETVRGMVLVHGGGGTAFAEWVRLWNERGYAAIAMDTCGCLPGGEPGERPRHEMGGPPGWGGWEQIDWPREDQWTYHAVADILLAHSLLASRPQVDAGHMGITGISWGGYLTCIAAGVDPRLRLAIPVYGCGFYPDTSFADRLDELSDVQRNHWLAWWDPSSYLPSAGMPMLWVTGTNDFAYWLPALQSSYRAAPGPRTLCIRVRMPHGHEPGWSPAEIYVFADSILRDGPPLPHFAGQERRGGTITARVHSEVPLARAELVFTRDGGLWPEREWETAPAAIDGGVITAKVPEGARLYYLNAIDERGLLVSSEHQSSGE
ncbi:MAG: alpha/beta hydrolase family protein [Armatimonadota bacterium]